jgi:hypothetical protein
VLARIAVPMAADGASAIETGRQWTMLQPYMSRSISSPGATNASTTFSSARMSVPPGASCRRSTASTSTGRDMSRRASSTSMRSQGPSQRHRRPPHAAANVGDPGPRARRQPLVQAGGSRNPPLDEVGQERRPVDAALPMTAGYAGS